MDSVLPQIVQAEKWQNKAIDVTGLLSHLEDQLQKDIEAIKAGMRAESDIEGDAYFGPSTIGDLSSKFSKNKRSQRMVGVVESDPGWISNTGAVGSKIGTDSYVVRTSSAFVPMGRSVASTQRALAAVIKNMADLNVSFLSLGYDAVLMTPTTAKDWTDSGFVEADVAGTTLSVKFVTIANKLSDRAGQLPSALKALQTTPISLAEDGRAAVEANLKAVTAFTGEIQDLLFLADTLVQSNLMALEARLVEVKTLEAKSNDQTQTNADHLLPEVADSRRFDPRTFELPSTPEIGVPQSSGLGLDQL